MLCEKVLKNILAKFMRNQESEKDSSVGPDKEVIIQRLFEQCLEPFRDYVQAKNSYLKFKARLSDLRISAELADFIVHERQSGQYPELDVREIEEIENGVNSRTIEYLGNQKITKNEAGEIISRENLGNLSEVDKEKFSQSNELAHFLLFQQLDKISPKFREIYRATIAQNEGNIPLNSKSTLDSAADSDNPEPTNYVARFWFATVLECYCDMAGTQYNCIEFVDPALAPRIHGEFPESIRNYKFLFNAYNSLFLNIRRANAGYHRSVANLAPVINNMMLDLIKETENYTQTMKKFAHFVFKIENPQERELGLEQVNVSFQFALNYFSKIIKHIDTQLSQQKIGENLSNPHLVFFEDDKITRDLFYKVTAMTRELQELHLVVARKHQALENLKPKNSSTYALMKEKKARKLLKQQEQASKKTKEDPNPQQQVVKRQHTKSKPSQKKKKSIKPQVSFAPLTKESTAPKRQVFTSISSYTPEHSTATVSSTADEKGWIQPNFKRDLNYAWRLADQQKYDEAIAFFSKVIESTDAANDSATWGAALYGKAHCLVQTLQMKNFLEAIKILKDLPAQWQIDYEVQSDLLQAYVQSGQFVEAIGHAKQMLRQWRSKPELLMILANCYSAVGQSFSAVSMYEQVTAKVANFNIQLNLVYSYIKTHQFETAFCLLNQFDKTRKADKEFVYAWSLCLIRQGNRQESCRYLRQQLQSHPQNTLLLERLIEQLIKMGDYPTALNQLSKMKPSQHSKATIQSLYALYYLETNQLSKVRDCLNQEMGKISAQRIYSRLIHCCISTELYEKALELSNLYTKQFPQSPFGELQKLKINQLRKIGESAVYLRLYDAYIKRFENSFEIYLEKTKYLIALQKIDPSTRDFIQEAIQRFPHQPRLHALLAAYYRLCKDYDKALEIVHGALTYFPKNYNLYLEQYKICLEQGDTHSANAIKKHMEQLFSNDKKMHNTIHALKNSLSNGEKSRPKATLANYLPVVAAKAVYSEDSGLKRALPHCISTIFNFLNTIGGHHYLVGSTVLKLLESEDLTKLIDIDFVTDCDPKELLRLGFKPNRNNPYLYTGSVTVDDKEVPVDIYVRPNRDNNKEAWLQRDANLRDFTVCSLYMDSEGNVIAPNAHSVDDAKTKILRSNRDSMLVLTENPVRILRALKYISRGYKPTQQLLTALSLAADKLDDSEHYHHLIAVLDKDLSSHDDKIAYLKLLNDFKILDKLFIGYPAIQSADEINQSFVKAIEERLLALKIGVVMPHRFIQPQSTIAPETITNQERCFNPKPGRDLSVATNPHSFLQPSAQSYASVLQGAFPKSGQTPSSAMG